MLANVDSLSVSFAIENNLFHSRSRSGYWSLCLLLRPLLCDYPHRHMCPDILLCCWSSPLCNGQSTNDREYCYHSTSHWRYCCHCKYSGLLLLEFSEESYNYSFR